MLGLGGLLAYRNRFVFLCPNGLRLDCSRAPPPVARPCPYARAHVGLFLCLEPHFGLPAADGGSRSLAGWSSGNGVHFDKV